MPLKTRFFGPLAAIVLLAGCATPESVAREQAAKQAAFREWVATRIKESWAPRCEVMGVGIEHPDFEKCVMQIGDPEVQAYAEAEARNRATRIGIGRALQNYGQTVYGNPVMMSVRRPVRTDCVPNQGGGFSCTRY